MPNQLRNRTPKTARRGKAAVAVALVLAATVLALAGEAYSGSRTAKTSTSAQATRAGTAVSAMEGEMPGLNPDLATGDWNQRVGCTVYEALTKSNTNGIIEPQLARSWTISRDGKTYTFHLVNTKWTDGQPFTSADVKYTLLHVSGKYSAIFSLAAKNIKSIATPNPRTVVIKLKRPYGPLLVSLGCGQGAAILPQHIFRGTDVYKNQASLTKPVGTGPFMLQKIERGTAVVMVRNPHYWRPGRPYLDQLIFKEFQTPSSMVLALRTHEVNLINDSYFPYQDIPVVKANHSLALHQFNTQAQDDYLVYNVKRPIVNNPLVRQALVVATDQKYLLNTVFFGVGTVGHGAINSFIKWAFDPKYDYAKLYPYDSARAGKMLDQAGYPLKNGTRFTIHLAVDASEPPLVSMAQALQALWKKVGVQVALDSLEHNTYTTQVFQRQNFDAYVDSYTSYGDPALGTARLFITPTVKHVVYGNASQYSNPTVDKLFQKAETAPTTAKRARFYYQVQAILSRDLPTVSLHQIVSIDAATANLHGLWNEDNEYWTDAWLSH